MMMPWSQWNAGSEGDSFAGCLPTLATIPIFWGLYRTLSNVSQAGLLTEGFYWIPSLSGPASLADQRAGKSTLQKVPGAQDNCFMSLPPLSETLKSTSNMHLLSRVYERRSRQVNPGRLEYPMAC